MTYDNDNSGPQTIGPFVPTLGQRVAAWCSMYDDALFVLALGAVLLAISLAD